MILLTHSSWPANGPEERLPSSPTAYQPLDAAYVGFIYSDVMGNDHCGPPVRSIISQAGLDVTKFAVLL
jgi:hypothetical protein